MNDDQLVSGMRAQGMSFAAIAAELGAPHTKDSLQKRQRKLHAQLHAELGTDTTGSLVRELLFDLVPLSFPAPKPATQTAAPSSRAFVASDFHWPLHDPACESILLQMVEDYKPAQFILNGDGPDLNGLSKYPRDMFDERWTLLDERTAMHSFMHRLVQVSHPACSFTETNANHSGNGVESRWRRYLSERIKELASIPEVADLLNYRTIFHPSWSPFDLVDTTQITPQLVALHGDIVRQGAGASARSMADKWQTNLIHGHTHRMGASGYRVPAIGDRGEGLVRAYEGGCMCKLTPHYGKGFDWQQGFVVVEYDADGDFNVVPVSIVNNKGFYNGRRYTA